MLLAALALLPLAGLLYYNAETQRREAATAAQNDVLRLVLMCANNEERMVDSADQLLALTAEMPRVKSLDAQACGPLFTRILGNQHGYRNLGLLDANGTLVASARPVALPGPVGERPFFRQALAQGKFAASDFEIETDGTESEMICGDPVRAGDGRVIGVVFAELDLAWMTRLDTRLELPASVSIGVLSHDGIILMRVPDPGHFVGRSALNGAAGRLIVRTQGSGTSDEEGLDHVRRLFAFMPIDAFHGLHSYVSAGIPDDIAFSNARNSEYEQIAMLVIFAIGALAAAGLAAEFLVLRGVRRLLKATQKVAAGDLKTRAGRFRGGGELRDLAQAFDAMASSLEKQRDERDAAERELERRVAERTAEIGEANRKLQQEIAERTRIEAGLRAFITNVPAILFSIDRQGVITMAEGLGMEVLRFVDGGIAGHSVDELYGDVPGVVESVRRALAGESLVTTMQLQQLYYEIAYSPIHDPDGTVSGVIGVAHDVTERHKAEQALEVSERRMRLIIENAYDAYVAMDRDGAIVDWNPQAERIFGWSREEAIGRSLAETIIPERMRTQHLKGLVHFLHSGEGPLLNRRIEVPGLRRDGAEFPVEMTIGTMRIEQTVIFSAFIHDISDRIRAKEELERTAAELRRSNEELEQFAYIASHDLQEPLRMVASYTQLLERRYAGQLDDAAREFIGYAVDGARRMQEFITGLLRYSRVGTEPQQHVPVNLREVFDTALANLRIAIEESGARVNARDLPTVRGDPRQLTQLLQNLIGNALKFRKPGQAPEIEVRAEPDGAFRKVSVRDNGIGLDPRFSDRVFTIFQRLHTRDEYEGTGLGLAICKKIVERHGGRIWVESSEGEGATFFFTLPGAEEATP